MSDPTDQQVISARWVFPVTGRPLADGTVTVLGDRIIAVKPAGVRTPDQHFGNAAIIPGLVNAHTHLDLTGMRGRVPPGPNFPGWLREVIAHRRLHSAEQLASDIRTGLDECLQAGTTLVGDISAGGQSWDALQAAPVWAMCYREILGLSATRVAAVWADLVRWMVEHPDTPTCRTGASPHAPYSVHKTLIEAATRLWPICIHLAESDAELELLERRTGPFVPFLQELGVWDPSGLTPSWEWVIWKTSRSSRALLAHGNRLPPMTRLPANTTVVYCPRTHAAFGHPPHPYRDLLAQGARVALGTDSLASNPDLDLLAEARFLFERDADLPADQILRMATLSGAESLGFEDRTGSLEPHKSADLVVLPLPDADPADPHPLIFASSTARAPRRTMWRGQWR